MERYVWNGLLIAMLLVAIWFSVKSLYHFYEYLSLSDQTYAKSTQWSVREISDERYLLEADYQYDVSGATHKGHTLLDDPSFRNRWAAEQMIPQYSAKQWDVWYASKNPEYSTLQKGFSLKESISAMLLWGVLVYFVWLRYYYAAKFFEKTK